MTESRDADLDALLGTITLPHADAWARAFAQQLAMLCRQARDAETTAYVRGWNDGEADAEALRVRAESAEAALQGMTEARDVWRARAQEFEHRALEAEAERDRVKADAEKAADLLEPLVRDVIHLEAERDELRAAAIDVCLAGAQTEAHHVGYGEARDCEDCPLCAAMDRLSILVGQPPAGAGQPPGSGENGGVVLTAEEALLAVQIVERFAPEIWDEGQALDVEIGALRAKLWEAAALAPREEGT